LIGNLPDPIGAIGDDDFLSARLQPRSQASL
jgi:hypothetical protein